MANLIELDDTHPQLRNPTSQATGILFGVIKREIFAVEESGLEENIGEYLQPGTLIQIKPGYQSDECHFKIRNFTNWMEKYKTTIYKCKKTDYITIKEELWPYLLGYNNDARLLKLVEDINKTEFDLDLLKLGGEVRIRGPPGNEGKYYEFVVAYNGLMTEISATGYHIGLQLKNDRVPLTSDLNRLSEYYRFGGIGIVVQIDWIMLNLYTEEERQPEPQHLQYNEPSSKVLSIDKNDSEPKNTNFKDFQNQSPIESSTRFSDTALSEINNSSPSDFFENKNHSPVHTMEATNSTTETGFNKNANGVVKMSETAAMPEDTCQMKPIDMFDHECSKKNNDENNVATASPINEQPKKIFENSAISKQRDQSPETPCGRSSNYRASEISEPGDIPHKREQYISSTSLINEQPKHTIAIDVTSDQSDQMSEPPLKPMTNYNPFKTEFSNIADGAVNESHDIQTLSINEQSNKLINIGAISEQRDQKFIEFINNVDETVKFTETLTRPLPIGPGDTGSQAPPINKQGNKTFDTSVMSKHRGQSPEIPYDSGSTYGAEIESVTKLNGTVKINESGVWPVMHQTLAIGRKTNNENYDVQTPSINDQGAVSKFHDQSPVMLYDPTSPERPVTNADGAMRNKEKNKCGFCSITVEIGDGFTLRECEHSFCTDCICFHVNKGNSKELEIRCPYKKKYECYFSLNDAEIKDFRRSTIYNKLPENRLKTVEDNVAELYEVYKSVHEPDDHKSWVQPTNVQSKIPYEADSSSQQFDQSPENPCDNTLNCVAEIEYVTNADGAVRNVEKTKCDVCCVTVEIGHGIILRECVHSFCTKCIRVHVYRNLKSSRIRCPYKQDYECDFDLQDVEIKDLGGETNYYKILDNRLKEFMATEPNARWCPNKACENVWVNQRKPHENDERCPKCKMNFCLVCQNAHEPDGRHAYKPPKMPVPGKVVKMVKRDQSEPRINCAVCGQTNIPADKCVRLKNCNHTMCRDCSMEIIGSQIIKLRPAKCTVCSVHLEAHEVAKITGFKALGLFRNTNRKIQPEIAATPTICFCRPPNGNCAISLKCKHTFCQTYIANIVQEQFNSQGRALCPRCLYDIDENIIRRLVPGLFKQEIVEICRTCHDHIVQYHLQNCKHGFCLNCIRNLIKTQVNDPEKMSVICTICNEKITDQDILRYGGQDTYNRHNSKIGHEAFSK